MQTGKTQPSSDLPARIAIAARSIRTASGLSRVALGLTKELARLGYRVDVHGIVVEPGLVRDSGGSPFAIASAGAIGRLRIQLLGRKRATRRMNERIESTSYDLVIGNGDLRRQDVLILHNIVAREQEELAQARGEDPRAVDAAVTGVPWDAQFRLAVANSELMRSELLKRSSIEPGHIEVIYPGYDPTRFNTDQQGTVRTRSRATLGLTGNETAIGFLTSGHFQLRGLDILIETLTKLPRERLGNCRVVIPATRRNARRIHDAFQQHRLADLLVVRDKVREIETWYPALDVLLHPARFETFGLVVQEAAACGCPVITSRSVGAAELFADAAADSVADTPDAGQFADLLNRCLTDTEYRLDVAERQHAAVAGNTWATYCQRFLAAVARHNLLATGPAPT